MTTKEKKSIRWTKSAIERLHCCYCSRDVHTLLHHSTKEGVPHQQKQRLGYPTPLLYATVKNEAICERCVGTYMLGINNGGKPVVGFERGNGQYMVSHRYANVLGQEIVDLDSDIMNMKL